MKKVVFIIGAFLFFLYGHAQNEINLRVTFAPPYPLNYSDLINQPRNSVEIQNLTGKLQNLQLTFRVYCLDNDVSLLSKPGKKSSAPLVVPPYGTIRISTSQLSDFFSKGNVISSGYSVEEIKQKRAVPEGYYFVCFTPTDYNTGQILGPEVCSNPIPMMALEPPTLRLTNPLDNDTLLNTEPQNIQFQWNTPSNLRTNVVGNVTTKIRIVEVLPGVDPAQAILSAPALTPEFTVYSGNAFVYGPEKTPLVKGRRYAAVLQMFDPNYRFNFRNDGKSEVITFVYGRPASANLVVAPIKKDTTTNTTTTTVVGTPVFTIPPSVGITVNGSVSWAFPGATNQTRNTPLVAETTIPEYTKTKSTEYDNLSIPYNLPEAMVQLYGLVQDASGKVVLKQALAFSKTTTNGSFALNLATGSSNLMYGSYQLTITHPSGLFESSTVIIDRNDIQAGKLNNPITLKARNVELTPRVQLVYGAMAGEITLDILKPGADWSKYGLNKGSTVNYNNQTYTVVATLTNGDAFNQIFQPVNATEGYLVRVNCKNRKSVFYPFPNCFVENINGQRPLVQVAKNFAYDLSSAFSGMVTYGGKPLEKVRVELQLNKNDIIPSKTSADTNTHFVGYTDASGRYTILGVGQLRPNARIQYTLINREVRDRPFDQQANWDGSSLFEQNFAIINPKLPVKGRVVGPARNPVENALVYIQGSEKNTTTKQDGTYSLVLDEPELEGKLTVKADGYRDTIMSLVSLYKGNTPYGSMQAWSYLNNKFTTKRMAAHLGLGNAAERDKAATPPDGSVEWLKEIGLQQSGMIQGLRLRLMRDGKEVSGSIKYIEDITSYTTNNTIPPWKYMDWIPENVEDWVRPKNVIIGNCYRGYATTTTFNVTNPNNDGTFFPYEFNYQFNKPGLLTVLRVNLVSSVLVSGSITDSATGSTIDSALITVEGFDLKTYAAGGRFNNFQIPRNRELRITCIKPGYSLKDTVLTITGGNIPNFNLRLSKLDGKSSTVNFKTLSGFSIKLTNVAPNVNPGSFTLSGKLTLPDNDVYKCDPKSKELTFRDVVVNQDPKDFFNALPIANITFDEAVVTAKAFGGITVEISGNPQLQLKPLDSAKAGDYTAMAVSGNIRAKFTSMNNMGVLQDLNFSDATIYDSAKALITDPAKGSGNGRVNYVFITPGKTVPALSKLKTYKLVFDRVDAHKGIDLKPTTGSTNFVDTAYMTMSLMMMAKINVERKSATISCKDGMELFGFLRFMPLLGAKMRDSGRIAFSKFLVDSLFNIKQLTFKLSETEPFTCSIQKLQAKLTSLNVYGLGSPNLGFGFGGLLRTKGADSAFKAGQDGVLTVKEFSLVNATTGLTIAAKFVLPESGISINGLSFTTPKPDKNEVSMSYNVSTEGFVLGASGVLNYKSNVTNVNQSSNSESEKNKQFVSGLFPITIKKFELDSKTWSLFLAAESDAVINVAAASLTVKRFVVSVGTKLTIDEMNQYLLDSTQKIKADANTDKPLDESLASWAVGIAGDITINTMGATTVKGSLIIGNINNTLSVRLNEIGLDVTSPVFTFSAKVKLAINGDKQGFEGTGTLNTTINNVGSFDLSLGFYRYASTKTYLVDAKLSTSKEMIIGPTRWYKMGGGFTYNSKEQKYTLTFAGDAGPIGTDKDVLYLKNINITLLFDVKNCGGVPIIKGTGTLNQLKKDCGNVALTIDLCNKLLMANINFDYEPLPEFSKFYMQGVLYAMMPQSGQKNGSFVLASYVDLQNKGLGSLLSGNADFAFAYNYNRANIQNIPLEVNNAMSKIAPEAFDIGIIRIDTVSEIKVPFWIITRNPFSIRVGWKVVGYNTKTINGAGILNAICLQGSVKSPNYSKAVDLNIKGFSLLYFYYYIGGEGTAKAYYKYLNAGNKFDVTAKIAVSAEGDFSLMTVKFAGKANAEANLTAGYDGKQWNAKGDVGLKFEMYNSESADCNSFDGKWVKCCCATWGCYPCGWQFLWSRDAWCCVEVCLGYPTFRFKVCQTLKGTFDYNGGRTKFSAKF